MPAEFDDSKPSIIISLDNSASASVSASVSSASAAPPPRNKRGKLLPRAQTMPNFASPIRKLGLSDSPGRPPRPARSHSSASLSSTASSVITQENADLDADLVACRRGLDLFLNSRMNEAETLLESKYRQSMYFTLGYAFINYLRALMTFQQADVEKALEALKQTVAISSSLRKQSGGILESVNNWMRGAGGVAALKAMTRVQRHAELVYAEAYLLKAILSIVNDETFVSFLREGLNIRASYATYRALQRFMDTIEEEAEHGENVSRYELDEHFTSGVRLGIGLFNLMLSLLPGRVLKVIEVMGFQGDRDFGLAQLELVGGWAEPLVPLLSSALSLSPSSSSSSSSSLDPANVNSLTVDSSHDGIRRQFCDMSLIAYHVVVSGFIPVRGANIIFAERVLEHNLKLYPRGVFFLYFAGRLQQIKTNLPGAVSNYRLSISIQKEWKQLHHICYWELMLIYIAQQEFSLAYEAADILCGESNWSKAVYTYYKAVALYSMGRKEDVSKVESLMQQVPKLLQRIAGKSIPIEKFVARKARKFIAQGNRLLLPSLELINVWNGYEIMPSPDLHRALASVETELARLETLLTESVLAHKADIARRTVATSPQKQSFFSLGNFLHSASTIDPQPPRLPYENFYDDLSLVYFLRGIITRQLGLPNNKAMLELSKESFHSVFDVASKITLDHYLFFFARYELGRTLVLLGKKEEAKAEFSIVLAHEGPSGTTGGKFSLENMLQFKCHNAIVELEELGKTKNAGEKGRVEGKEETEDSDKNRVGEDVD